MAGGWLALASYPMDDSTGFDGVRLFPQYTTARIDAGTVTFEHDVPAYVCDPDEPLCDPEEVAEELEADVVSALRYAIARSSERPHLELTGGKDSRLVLAVALRAGLADSFTCVTYGPEHLPDMQVARSIAEALRAASTRTSRPATSPVAVGPAPRAVPATRAPHLRHLGPRQRERAAVHGLP